MSANQIPSAGASSKSRPEPQTLLKCVDLADLASQRRPHGVPSIPLCHGRDAEVHEEGLEKRLSSPQVAEDGRQVEAARQHHRGGQSELVGPGMSSTMTM